MPQDVTLINVGELPVIVPKQIAELIERRLDAIAGALVGLQVFLIAGEQVTALPGFRLG